MTYQQLRMERRINKIRETVDDEIKSLKRKEEIIERLDTIFSVMTAILLFALTFAAFVVDAFGFMKIPSIIWIIGFCYLMVYIAIIYKRLTK